MHAPKLFALALTLCVAAAASPSFADTVEKGSTGTELTSGASWTNGTTPTSADIGFFDSASNTSSAAAPFTLSSSTTWGAIQVTDSAAPVFISVAASTWTVAGNASASTFLDLSSASQDLTIDGSGGTRTLRLSSAVAGSYTANVAAGRTFTLGSGMIISSQTGTRTLTFTGGGNFIINGAVATGGNLSVNINDAGGTVTFAGANTYNKTTTVTAGTLILNGTHAAGGAYTVSSGATLAGAGTITSAAANSLTVSGTLAPGSAAAPIGTFSFLQSGTGVANASLAGIANFDIDLSADAADKLVVGNALTYGGTLNISATGSNAAPESFDLFDFSSQSGSFSAINVTGLADGQTSSFDPTTGILSVSAAAPAPEPASLALLTFGALALARRRRPHSTR